MFKLIISDLDGTLVDSNKNITPFTKKIITELHNQGIHFVIATGRGYRGALKAMKDLELKCEIICNNGASIYDANGKLMFQRIIGHKCAMDIFNLANKYNSIFIGSFEEHIYIPKGKVQEAREFIHSPQQHITEFSNETFNSLKFEKIVILNKDNDVLKNLQEHLNSCEHINSFISQNFFLDIVHHQSSKGTALKYIADFKNISLENTLAFGDAFNDFDMLKFAGKGVVMANGFQELKDSFKDHSLSNDENGVAHYLHNIFNLKVSLD